MKCTPLSLGALLGAALAGCGSNSAKAVDAGTQDGAGTTPGGDAGSGAPPGTMVVTSPAFAEAGTIPTDNTCKGANTSPALAWTGAPSTTKSFAVVLSDLSLSPVLVHWVIYDIPATATGLPADIENTDMPTNVSGARQLVSVHPPTIGYYGPCPPSLHNYQFAVYALDAEMLPGITAQSTRPDAAAAIQTHRLDDGTLTGMFGP